MSRYSSPQQAFTPLNDILALAFSKRVSELHTCLSLSHTMKGGIYSTSLLGQSS